MHKEPFSLYLLRLFIWLGILVLAAMIYWSSLITEESIRSIKTEINSLKKELSNKKFSLQTTSENEFKKKSASLEDPSLPNLLTKDPFLAVLANELGKDFIPKGTIREATIGKYDHLLPITEWAEVGNWNNLCVPSLATSHVGKYETLAPGLAYKIEERKSEEGGSEFWVHLRDDIYWQPLEASFFSSEISLDESFTNPHPVTAEDFKFFYDVVMNPYMSATGAISLRSLYEDIVQFKVINPKTFVVKWKAKEIDGKMESKYISKSVTAGLKPMPSFVYKYYANGKKIVEDDSDPDTYRKSSIWALSLMQHFAKNIIVSCGPWVFDGKTERMIRFKRNENYFEPLAVLVEKKEIQIKESAANAWLEFKNNNLTLFNLQPDQILELELFKNTSNYKSQENEKKSIEKIKFFERVFHYIGWNEKKFLFENKKVRQALTMSINRQSIIERFLNGLGKEILGPVFPFDSSYNKNLKPWPFDVELAKKILKEEGWYDHDGDGIIEKEINGKLVPFKFTLKYVSRSLLSKNVVEFIASSLKEVGIDCRIQGVDIPDIAPTLADKNFDAMMLGWSFGAPPENFRQIWYSDKNNQKGSSNYISFNNKEVDEIIDRLDYEKDPEKRRLLSFRFQEIIHEEAPYLFLFCPETVMAYRQNLQNVFLPINRQDLIPGADIAEPDPAIYWLKED